MGRRDDQVKVRGYRIELGEIEVVLSRHAQVAECAVVVDGQAPGDERLVAYVVAGTSELSVSALRAQLAERLPGYMMPQAIETLPVLPRLGKRQGGPAAFTAAVLGPGCSAGVCTGAHRTRGGADRHLAGRAQARQS